MQGVEVGDAVHTEHHGFAVNDKLHVPVLARGLDDPGEAAGPVIAAAGDQAHAIAVAGHDQAVAVILHFVEPDRAIRHAERSLAAWGMETASGNLYAGPNGRLHN